MSKGTIPRSFIDDMISRTDLVALIGSRIKLKKAGVNHTACCPFHFEKTPSFSVSGKKQFYHCFGCGKSGNVITFLMEYDKLEFVETIEELAAMHGLDVPYERRFNQHNNEVSYASKRTLFELTDQIVKHYQKYGKQEIAQQYFQNRALSNEIIEKFELGFAPDSFDDLLKHFSKNKEQTEQLVQAGMLSQSENGRYYDRFRGRIIFPIRDRRGRCVGFGGRILDNDKSKAKYLNSPESAIYHKGSELYGLYQALKVNENPDSLLVVEGYMDAVAMVQFGIENVVASLGTATTAEQLNLMYRATDTVICCYDGDNAGRGAAKKALENALTLLEDGRVLKFMFLPEGEDPDSFIRKFGVEAFHQAVLNAMDFESFFFQYLGEDLDLSTLEGRSKLAAITLPLIEKIKGETFKLHLRKILGQKIGVFDENELNSLAQKYRSFEKHTQQPKPTTSKKMTVTPVRVLIALLLQNPELVQKVPDISPLTNLKMQGLDFFIDLVKNIKNLKTPTLGSILAMYQETKFVEHLKTLGTWDLGISDDVIEDYFTEALEKLYKQVLEARLDVLINKARTSSLTQEEEDEMSFILGNRVK